MFAVVRELVVAGTFGVGEDLDAVFAGLVVPVFVVGILMSTVQASLLPELVAARSREGEEAFGSLISSAATLVTLLTVGIALVLFLLSGPIMAAMTTGLGERAQTLAVDAFRVAIPVVLAGGVVAVWSSGLQAVEAFASSSLALVVVPAVPAAVVAAGGADAGVLALAWGVAAGHFLALVPLGFGLSRRGVSVRPVRPTLAPRIRSAARQSTPVAGGSLVHASAPVVDIGMAGSLGGGNIAALQFGSRVVEGGLGVMSSAVGVTVFPLLARFADTDDREGLLRAGRRWIGVSVAVGAAAALAVGLLSDDIVRVLFRRGAFSEGDVGVVASVQALYAIQIPFYMAGIVLARIVHVLRRNRLLLVTAVVTLALNVGLNYLLMQRLGAAGIALSTSIVYMVSVAMVSWGVARIVTRMPTRPPGPGGDT